MKIGLDIDGVLADFPAAVIHRAHAMGFCEYFPRSSADVSHWGISDKFPEVMKDAWNDPLFWLSVPPVWESYGSIPMLDSLFPSRLKCYITSRPIPTWVTEKWLGHWGFPNADVITVSKPEDKLRHIRERDLDLFVDDYHITVEQLLDAGVIAKLFKAPYQRGHKVDHLPTISSLREVYEFRETATSI
jgi:hypothetical protein